MPGPKKLPVQMISASFKTHRYIRDPVGKMWFKRRMVSHLEYGRREARNTRECDSEDVPFCRKGQNPARPNALNLYLPPLERQRTHTPLYVFLPAKAKGTTPQASGPHVSRSPSKIKTPPRCSYKSHHRSSAPRITESQVLHYASPYTSRTEFS